MIDITEYYYSHGLDKEKFTIKQGLSIVFPDFAILYVFVCNNFFVCLIVTNLRLGFLQNHNNQRRQLVFF